MVFSKTVKKSWCIEITKMKTYLISNDWEISLKLTGNCHWLCYFAAAHFASQLFDSQQATVLPLENIVA
jgi:hypothetical protein